MTSAPPQASSILACLGQAAFVWDIASDEIAWTDHLASVFPDIPAESLSTGGSLIVSDQGINAGETGEGTDFIIPLR